MNNRRSEKPPMWVGWIGDMGVITQFLLTKSWLSPWCIPKGINSILRAIGTVAFANNPITGIVILIAMFVGNPHVGAACILAGFIGVVFSKLLKQPEILINDGVTVFNGILLGCISVAVVPSITGRELDGAFWCFLTIGIIIEQYVDKGLNSLMAPSKLPAYSLPFNLTAAVLMLTLRSAAGLEGRHVPQELDAVNITSNATAEEINWTKVFEGTLLASGQIYGVGTVDSSILVYLAFFLYSPLLTLFLYIGSLIGTLIGAVASVAPYTEVYLGLWGYNAMLTAGGISFFLVPTPRVVLASIAGATMAAAVQAASLHIFSATSTPVLSYPFNVATILVCAISTAENSPFTWVPNRTFPEWHLFKHYRGDNNIQVVADSNAGTAVPLTKDPTGILSHA